VNDAFLANRRLLFTIAYEMLGSVADAEDVVQDAWVRWSRVDHDAVADPRGYLVRITSRLALNRLRDARARREAYVGPWLPEPLLTEPDPADQVTQALLRTESLSMALLVLLETLSPLERAVFVLHDVFGLPYPEIARAVRRRPGAVRQTGHRAREHIKSGRPRFPADAAERRAVTERFLTACYTGDLAALLDLLAPDVVLLADGGGKAKAALRPVCGADRVARLLVALPGQISDVTVAPALINGSLGVIGHTPRGPDFAGLIDLRGGKITQIFLIRNPDKLTGVTLPPPNTIRTGLQEPSGRPPDGPPTEGEAAP
jgi:RNA polymerase sigma-70 factor, ECF subfamily